MAQKKTYSEAEVAKIQKLQRQKPRFFRRIIAGGIIGGLLAAVGLGYKENAQSAMRSAELEARAVAQARAEINDNRTTWQKITGKGIKPTIKEPTRADILKRAPKHFNVKPNMPITTPREAGKVAGTGAAAGAALGLLSYAKKRRKISRQIRTLGTPTPTFPKMSASPKPTTPGRGKLFNRRR